MGMLVIAGFFMRLFSFIQTLLVAVYFIPASSNGCTLILAKFVANAIIAFQAIAG
jgi:hypothetical protein